MRRAILLCVLAVLVWAWIDRIVWGLMFEPHHVELAAKYGQDWLSIYHWGWADALRGMILLGVVGLWPNKRAMLWYFLVAEPIATSGLEDALYYWLQGAPIPPRLEWLDDKWWAFAPVTPAVIAGSVLVHITAAALLGVLITKARIPVAFQAYFSKQVVRGETNPTLLKEQAAALFGERFVNCDDGVIASDTRGLGVYLEGKITPEDEKAWDAVILAHDGAQKTADQEVEEAEKAETASLKDAAANWGVLDAETKDYMMQLTVQRAARTEG